MYSDLPVLTRTHRCLSWSGFMEEHFNVRGGCLHLPESSILSTDGASFIYDGTPLVKQSVDRVRTSSHTHELSTLLLTDVTHREPRSCMCLSTIVLDLSASLKDPRLWSEGPSTSACTTNGLLWSGCRRTSHRLAAILPRYVHGSSYCVVLPPIVGHAIHDRSPFSERAQEQRPSPFTTSTTIFPPLPEPLYALVPRASTRFLIS